MNGENIAVVKLNEALRNAIKSLGVDDVEDVFEKPKHEGHGDRAANSAMKLAKRLKANPREVAQKILDNLTLKSDVIIKSEIAGPGFLNIFLSGKFYSEVINDILKQGKNYGSVNIGQKC